MSQTKSSESYSYYELRAVYATDHASGATIEQVFEGTAPADLGTTGLKQVVADWTGRMQHDIEELEVIVSEQRDDIESVAVLREGSIELGGI